MYLCLKIIFQTLFTRYIQFDFGKSDKYFWEPSFSMDTACSASLFSEIVGTVYFAFLRIWF